MKRITLLLLNAAALLAMFLLSSCSEEVSSSGITDYEGFVYSDEGAISGATVKLNSDSTMTDKQGRFFFRNVRKSEFMISVSHPEFYSLTMRITDRKQNNFSLVRKCYDYFPLKTGNKWKYHYVRSGYIERDGFDYPGLVEWEVISESRTDSGMNYKIKETHYDSLSSVTTISYFGYRMFTSDSLIVEGTSKIWVSYVSSSGYRVRRYWPIETNEVAEPGTYKLKRNTGMTYFRHGYARIHQGMSVYAGLISSVIN